MVRCLPRRWVVPSKYEPKLIWEDSGAGGKKGSMWLINSMELMAVTEGHLPAQGTLLRAVQAALHGQRGHGAGRPAAGTEGQAGGYRAGEGSSGHGGGSRQDEEGGGHGASTRRPRWATTTARRHTRHSQQRVGDLVSVVHATVHAHAESHQCQSQLSLGPASRSSQTARPPADRPLCHPAHRKARAEVVLAPTHSDEQPGRTGMGG